ncbi:hypothetical protein [Saccharomonospora piscinae]|uniref:hypothetical protein n=1 Tax=Saccharomonospora piscinae TaxID=687388 RepID=UPI00046459A6|nr:hypothetical protein [Saccharomonospora piscinae]
MEQLVGGVYSAMSADLLPAPDRRPALTESLTRAVEAHAPFVEDVRVHLLLGTLTHEGRT